MVQKIKGAKIYKSMQGKQVDMDLLRKRNELTPAVGNARVNARGDELGAGGEITRKREDLLKDYYENSKGAPSEKAISAKNKPENIQENNDWVEDDDGNFVKKGE